MIDSSLGFKRILLLLLFLSRHLSIALRLPQFEIILRSSFTSNVESRRILIRLCFIILRFYNFSLLLQSQSLFTHSDKLIKDKESFCSNTCLPTIQANSSLHKMQNKIPVNVINIYESRHLV